MNYIKIYHEIILKAKFENRRKNKEIYYEKHHITPKCKSGDNSEENLVLLTNREHFLCHKLLYKAFPDDYQLFFSFKTMLFVTSENRYIASSREFEYIKRKHQGVPLSEEHRRKISEANKGFVKTEETIQKIKDGLKEYWSEHESWFKGVKRSEETVEKVRISLVKYWENLSSEELAAWSLKFSGENNANFGKPRSEEVKSKISSKKSMEIIFDGNPYLSITDASEKLGKSIGSIQSKLNREQEKCNPDYQYIKDSSKENRTKNRIGNRKGGKRILFNGLEYSSMTECAKILGKCQTRIAQIMKKEISENNSLYQFLP